MNVKRENKITVVILMGQLGLGGGEKQLYLFLKGIDRARFDPYVISFNPGANDYWEPYIRSESVEILYVSKNGNRYLRMITALKLIRSLRADVVHSWDIFANPVVFLARMFTSATCIGGVRCNVFRPGRSSRDRFIATYGVKNFITNSSQGKEHLVKLGKKADNIDIVFNAVTLPEKRINRKDIRARFSVSDNDILIIHVGSVKPVKDQQFLIDTIIPMMDDKRIHVLFIGEGSDRQKLMKYVEQKGHADRIIFPGQLPEAITYMMASDIYCLTSVTEGMSNALCEAMACALPVLSTPVGGVKDLIHDGENGFVIPHGDKELFRKRLSILIDNSNVRTSFGAEAKKTIVEKFTNESFIQKMSGAYEKFYALK